MINKYKTYSALVKDYKPIKQERLLKALPLSIMLLKAKKMLGLEVTYFNYRPSLTPEQRKVGDMQFLTHYERSHTRSAQNASRGEKIRYYWLKFRYLPEISYINNQIIDKNDKESKDLPKDIELYLLRWQYLLNVPPKFVELIHGTDPATAEEALLSLT